MAVSWSPANAPEVGEVAAARPADGTSARVFSLPGQVLETNHPGNIAGLDAFLETVVGLAGAQAGVIRALTHDGGYMRLVAAVGLSEEFLQRELLINTCGVCGEAVRDDDIHSASDFRGCSQLFSAHRGGGRCFRHVLAVPLEYKGHPIGVFNLFFDHPEDCKPNVKTLLRPIGQLLGLTLENSLLERERARASIVHERQAMAADIHDSLAQTLAFGRMRVPLIEDAITGQDPQQALRFCGELRRELTQAHGALRGLITHFRAGLDSAGLRRGLREAIARFREASGIPLEFDNQIPDLKLRGEVEVQVFYIVQEALANVCKHAKATRTRLSVEYVAGGVEFSIEDNGAGQGVALMAQRVGKDDQGSFGLRIMQERAERFGGRLEIENMPKGGTRVRVFIPEDAVTEGTGGVRDE
jgi:two-component system nitrate/nitrite sensor histidine kinase NarX